VRALCLASYLTRKAAGFEWVGVGGRGLGGVAGLRGLGGVAVYVGALVESGAFDCNCRGVSPVLVVVGAFLVIANSILVIANSSRHQDSHVS